MGKIKCRVCDREFDNQVEFWKHMHDKDGEVIQTHQEAYERSMQESWDTPHKKVCCRLCGGKITYIRYGNDYDWAMEIVCEGCGMLYHSVN